MKKTLVVALVAGLISLGFSVVNRIQENTLASKIKTTEKLDSSDKLNEKRLACWD